MIHPNVIGLVVAVGIVVSISAMLFWMLHPPAGKAERAAREAEVALEEMIGSVIVVFSQEIHSEHMMLLAARLARRERAELLVAYVIEVPHTLPLSAEMEIEHRIALDALATAEAIGRKNDVEIQTEIVRSRQVAQGLLELAKRKDARLIVMGSYREGKYTGAPLAHEIAVITANAACDVLIGVQGKGKKLLSSIDQTSPVIRQ
jgi:nucleotide-binding universal stress UspA family protein